MLPAGHTWSNHTLFCQHLPPWAVLAFFSRTGHRKNPPLRTLGFLLPLYVNLTRACSPLGPWLRFHCLWEFKAYLMLSSRNTLAQGHKGLEGEEGFERRQVSYFPDIQLYFQDWKDAPLVCHLSLYAEAEVSSPLCIPYMLPQTWRSMLTPMCHVVSVKFDQQTQCPCLGKVSRIRNP